MDMPMLISTAVEVPVNAFPLLDYDDMKTLEDAVAYNAAGMDLRWNFVTPLGVQTSTAVVPTTGGGSYDWTHKGDAIYTMKLPASGGASANNDTVGVGWISGKITGVLPFRGPMVAFMRRRSLDRLMHGATFNAEGGRIWYADPTALGLSTNPGTFAAPYDTFANALAACFAGEEIQILTENGTVFDVWWNITKRITVRADSGSINALTVSNTGYTRAVRIATSGIKLIGLFLQFESSDPDNIDKPCCELVAGIRNVLFESIDSDSPGPFIFADGTIGVHALRCNPASRSFGYSFNDGASGWLLDDNYYQASSGWSEAEIVGGEALDVGVVVAEDSYGGRILNSYLRAGRDQASGKVFGVVGSNILIVNTHIEAALGAGTGGTYCLAGNRALDAPLRVVMVGGSLTSDNDGSGLEIEIDAHVAGSCVVLIGVKYDPAKCLGSENIFAFNDLKSALASITTVNGKLNQAFVDFAASNPENVSIDDLASAVIEAVTAANNAKVAADSAAAGALAAAAKAKLDRTMKGVAYGTAAAASTTTKINTSALTPPATVANQFKGRIVIFADDTTTAALRGHATDIKTSTALGVLNTSTMPVAPAAGDTFTIT